MGVTILQNIERGLDPPENQNMFVDNCAQCSCSVYTDDECWSDVDNNIFCSEDCAKKYYQIREKYINVEELVQERKWEHLEDTDN